MIPILAQTPPNSSSVELWLPILASFCVGGGMALLILTLVNALHTEDLEQDNEWRYDVNRINELRQRSILYRLFQPVIQSLALMNERLFADELPKIEQEIHAAGLPRFWTAPEYLARFELMAIFASPFYLYIGLDMMGPAGILIAVLATVLTVYGLRLGLSRQAERRLFEIKRRMPFLLDLLTLLMEAGSTFIQALQEAVEEFRDHPVGAEFGRVLGEISMGKSRTAALEGMRDRLQDDEITSIIGSIVQGENLGTPLARLFRTQADVLRVKRTQRAETIAGEAGVKMLLPAILVMASTVLIILGPFVISFVYEDFLS